MQVNSLVWNGKTISISRSDMFANLRVVGDKRRDDFIKRESMHPLRQIDLALISKKLLVSRIIYHGFAEIYYSSCDEDQQYLETIRNFSDNRDLLLKEIQHLNDKRPDLTGIPLFPI